MYNIKLENYVPKPNPAKSDYIVAAHYYSAWKKGVAGLHDGFNDLAEEWPDRTPLMGYYNEENPEVTDWEIKWALEHGINCFIYCWYRKKENEGKPVTVDALRCAHGIHEGLFNAKYGNMMNFAIMFEMSPRWGATDKEDLINNLMPFWMENYFLRDNYLKIDNKPVLLMYNADSLKENFTAEEQIKAFDECREYCKKFGFDGMIFAAEDYAPLTEKRTEKRLKEGFDFAFSYAFSYHSYFDESDAPESEILAAHKDYFTRLRDEYHSKYLTTVSCFYDSKPRHSQRWRDLGYTFYKDKCWHQSPENFRKMLKNAKEIADNAEKGSFTSRMIMLDNWNEWDEGHFISPSHLYGFKFLQAIREELTQRDNLPDYRTPADCGFTGYDKGWKIPDFKEFCEKKLNEK